jgi:uncharacterized SAM-binding protein YcdF (DUF218 family)
MADSSHVLVTPLRIVMAAAFLWVCATVGASGLIVTRPLQRADVLFVLAGAGSYGERLMHAAQLYHGGTANRILLTNDGQLQSWSRTLQRNPLSAERGVLTLNREGVPTDRIDILPGIVHGTSDEAFAIGRYAKEHGIRSVVAVTSPYHTRRTFWILRQVLPTSVIVGVDPTTVTPAAAPSIWWARADGWQAVGPEFIKLPYYWIRFGAVSPRAD